MDKRLFVVFFCLSVSGYALANPVLPLDANSTLLPNPYPVYVIENKSVINHSYPGASEVFLPTDNSYTEAPGCYIACYAHNHGMYAVGQNIYVIGQIRVKGHYVNRLCQPDGFLEQDLSKAHFFQMLCSKKLPACAGENCWAGGDTGGWFGIQ